MYAVLSYSDEKMPFWWNKKGFQMTLDVATRSLVAITNGKVADVRLARISDTKILVSWKLQFDYMSKIEGQLMMPFDYVREAFALSEGQLLPSETKNYFMDRELSYHVVRPGYFIRYGQYLSIPGPKVLTCEQCADMNIAIQIQDDMIEAVRILTQ